MEIVFGAVLLACVAAFVLRPLLRAARRGRGARIPRSPTSRRRKEAKYREIRDAQLDLAAGKLSEEDFERPGRGAAAGGGGDPRAELDRGQPPAAPTP